ncbi:MAG: DUF2807 domain-containing protein [Cyclobacteriaceae bacterium]|nr:DUF2807 domain-containing protein [Cyclobacteriaceae bacterium]
MKNQFILSIVLLIVLQGCSNEDIYLTGNGEVKSHALSVNSFDGISIEGKLNLRITQSLTQTVSIETTDLIYSYMEWSVKNNTLYVGFDKNVRFRDNNIEIWVNISVPDLKSISASGINDIISEGDLTLQQLVINLSGIASVSLSGTVNDQHIEVSGTAHINNYNFQSQKTSIEISGIGYIELYCAELLDINVSGDATVSYKGHPSIVQRSTGVLELLDGN